MEAMTITPQLAQSLLDQHPEVPALLAQAGLRMPRAGEPLKLSHEQYHRFLKVLDISAHEETLLTYGDITALHGIVPAIFGALAAEDGTEALERFARYKRLTGPVRVLVEPDGTRTSIRFSYDGHTGVLPASGVVIEQIILMNILRTGTGQKITPLRVESPRPYGTALKEFFGGSSHRAAQNSLVLASHDLALPFTTRNNVMWEYVQPALDQELMQLDARQSFLQTVSLELTQMIPSGSFGIEKLAAHLGMSSRSLQRRLKEEGTSYKAVCQRAQQNLASAYLSNPALSLQDVALLTGYTEVSSFSRAFKAWTGMTVTDYRKENRETS